MVKSAQTVRGKFYWMRVTAYQIGATLSLDGGFTNLVDAYVAYVAPIGHPWARIEVTGTITFEAGDTADEEYPGPIYGG